MHRANIPLLLPMCLHTVLLPALRCCLLWCIALGLSHDPSTPRGEKELLAMWECLPGARPALPFY